MLFCACKSCLKLHLLIPSNKSLEKVNMSKKVIKEVEIAGKKLVLETGELAWQADMAVRAQYGDSVVLVTVVSSEPNPDLDYFPLSVVFQERLFASGTIKSSRFVKRDGRPTDEAIVKRRLIDHAIRPLFPQELGFMNEVQVAVNVLALDNEADVDFLSMVGVSAALHASDVPWAGPMSTIRVGYVKGDYIANPALEVLETESDLDLMVSFVGKDKRFLAMEAEANVLSEEKVLGAIKFAQDEVSPVLDIINDFAEAVNPGLKKAEFISNLPAPEVKEDISKLVKDRVIALIKEGLEKEEMKARQSELLEEIYKEFEGKYKKDDMKSAFEKISKAALQHLILEEGKRPDGRAPEEIRPLSAKINVLPRVHGSAIFSRGLTQVMNIVTLGSPDDGQIIQDMYGERTKRYIHHYSFPPFSVGETGRMGGAGGREIGHGMLAEKALRPVIPDQSVFPYAILTNSETLSSNGSSSMASTCASSLSLMAAGVPLKEHVAGIGIGLVVNEDFSKKVLLTDIAGIEDGSGYMDFKMTGTREGVTAIQVDIKSKGIEFDMLPEIFKRSKDARMHVLDVMDAAIKEPNSEVSEFAPKTASLKIQPDQIGMVIGSGGKVIKKIQEDTGTDVSIEEDGTVVVSGVDKVKVAEAAEIIHGMTRLVEAGEVFEGEVEELAPYGAFVNFLPGKTGLLHISEISNDFVDKVEDHLEVGQTVKVKVLEVSRDGKYSLSIKALDSTGGNSNDRGEKTEKRHDRGGHDRNGGRGRDNGRNRRHN